MQRLPTTSTAATKGDRMNYEDYLREALEMVLAWDLPQEELADAVMTRPG